MTPRDLATRAKLVASFEASINASAGKPYVRNLSCVVAPDANTPDTATEDHYMQRRLMHPTPYRTR